MTDRKFCVAGHTSSSVGGSASVLYCLPSSSNADASSAPPCFPSTDDTSRPTCSIKPVKNSCASCTSSHRRGLGLKVRPRGVHLQRTVHCEAGISTQPKHWATKYLLRGTRKTPLALLEHTLQRSRIHSLEYVFGRLQRTEDFKQSRTGSNIRRDGVL